MTSDESGSGSGSGSESEYEPETPRKRTAKRKHKSSKPASSSKEKTRVRSPKPRTSTSKKAKLSAIKEPPRGDGVPVTANYAPEEKIDPVKDLDYNGYLGNGWYLRISRYDKGNKSQYCCIRRYDDAGPGKFGANLQLDMIPALAAAVADLHQKYKDALI